MDGIALGNIPGITVMGDQDSDVRSVLLEQHGTWFDINVDKPGANVLDRMTIDSRHWLLYGNGKGAMVKVNCSSDDYIPITKEVIRLLTKHDAATPFVIIPLVCVEINAGKTTAKAFSPFKAENWVLTVDPAHNYALAVEILKD